MTKSIIVEWVQCTRRLRERSAFCMEVAITALVPLSAHAQNAPSNAVNRFAGLDSLVGAAFATDSLGSITVGVIAGSDLVWTHSYGFADMKAHRLADRRTVYRIGSITKPFTAVMLMQLVAAGKVQLSDPVERYFPEIKQVGALPSGAVPITFLQLATMTAGLDREPREEGPFWTGSVSTWEQTLIAALPHTSYISVPGTQFFYSNIGYAILGAALGRVAGTPYTEWERTRVLKPLGMDRTRFEIDSSIAKDVARGYNVAPGGTVDDETAAREAREGRGYKVPNGAIFTTIDDLSRFVAFELGNGPASVLPRARLDSAFAGFVATSADLSVGYGLGFMANRRGTFTYVGHGGAVAGYQAAMYFDRAAQRGVIVFRNVAGGKVNPDALAVSILSRVIEQHTEIALASGVLDRYVGRYEFTPTFMMTVTREGNQLFTQATGQPKVAIFPESERGFFLKAANAQITFELDSQGRATALTLHQGGGTQRARRLDR